MKPTTLVVLLLSAWLSIAEGSSWRPSPPQRRSTEDERNRLQYRTNRGPIPVHVVDEQMQNAPPPPAAGERTRQRSGYPHVYRNQEGPPERARQNFDPRLASPPGPGPGPGPRAHGGFYEYPIATTPEHAHRHRFDYDRRRARARQAEARENGAAAAPPSRRGYFAGLWPLNDPGPTRAVVRAGGGDTNAAVVVGVMDHPPGSRRGFERAPFEPIDRRGRQVAVGHRDAHARREQSYPSRGFFAGLFAGRESRHGREL